MTTHDPATFADDSVQFESLRGHERTIWDAGFLLGQFTQSIAANLLASESDHLYRIAFDAPTPKRNDPTLMLVIVEMLGSSWAVAYEGFATLAHRDRAIWVAGFEQGIRLESIEHEQARVTRDRFAHAAHGQPPPRTNGPTFSDIQRVRAEITSEAVAQNKAERKKRPPGIPPMVSDARAAVARLRQASRPSPVDLALAKHLEAIAQTWTTWLPAEPSHSDLAALEVIRAVLA